MAEDGPGRFQFGWEGQESNDQYLKMAGRDKRWKRLPDLWEYVVPLGTTPEGEALSHEADAAFERKFGHPAGEHAMRWPPFRPGFKQMRYGDISSEYERFGITTHQKFQTLKEWCKATASQPSSRYGTPFKSTAGSCSSSPNLKGFAATGIPGEPAGILLTEGLGDHGLKGDAAIVLSNIAVLHPPPARHDKDAQMQRLLEMQHTVACCVSANNSSSCSEVGSRVSSMASSLNPSHASSLLCTPEFNNQKLSEQLQKRLAPFSLQDNGDQDKSDEEDDMETDTREKRALREVKADKELSTILESMSRMTDFDAMSPRSWGYTCTS